MADQKVSDLPSLNGADVDPADLLYIIDSSAGSAGSKKITVGQYQLAPVSGGTANTVVYLNGSKVESSSVALTFDGTNFATTGTASAAKLIPTGGTATGNGMYLPAANTLGWSTNGAEVMRLDSSGNLGLGVTPSAWASSTKAIQTPAGSLYAQGGSSFLILGQNVYGDGTNDRYVNSATASRYYQNAGAHIWDTAPSGTAGAAISFTQAMTLDASGNLLVGATTSPGSPNAQIVAGGTTDPGIQLASTSDGGGLILGAPGGGINLFTYTGAIGSESYSERARITSGGDLLVGTTTLSAVGNSIFGSSVPGVIHQNNNAAANGFVFTSYRRSSVEIGSVSQNGTTAVLFNTTSDRRLKDNIVPAPSASNVIDAIQIVSHDWKSAPDEHVTFGVIAQDLALVAPQAVLQGDDGDEIEKTWGVDYSKLVPMLIKEIQSLRARVAALESA